MQVAALPFTKPYPPPRDKATLAAYITEAAMLEQIADWVDKIESVMQGLARNLNRQLAMEDMLLAL